MSFQPEYSICYASSNRSKCKGKCNQKIKKNTIRFGKTGFNDFTTWKCLGCQNKRILNNTIKKVECFENIKNWSTLSKIDQDFIKFLYSEIQNSNATISEFCKTEWNEDIDDYFCLD